jgi:hypothetical protein
MQWLGGIIVLASFIEKRKMTVMKEIKLVTSLVDKRVCVRVCACVRECVCAYTLVVTIINNYALSWCESMYMCVQ